MQRILSVLVVGGGLAFLAGEYAPSPSDREEQMAAMTRIVARATILEPETVPAELPGLRRPVASPAAVTVARPPSPAAATPAPTTEFETAALPAVVVAAPTPEPAIATAPSPIPGAGVQRRLAREIQSELKRVGCYSGRLDGSWGDRSRSAMATFMARVNAQLPTTEPDVFLLSLIKGQTHAVCGPSCGRNEVLSGDRCIARAIVADAAPPASEPRAQQSAAVAAVRSEPLPGRMSIGGPLQSANVANPPVITSETQPETLPWQAPAAVPPAREQRLAALTPADTPRPIVAAPAIPRKITKVKRTWAAPARPKPVKRRYTSQRSVQMLFLHPLGRM